MEILTVYSAIKFSAIVCKRWLQKLLFLVACKFWFVHVFSSFCAYAPLPSLSFYCLQATFCWRGLRFGMSWTWVAHRTLWHLDMDSKHLQIMFFIAALISTIINVHNRFFTKKVIIKLCFFKSGPFSWLK